MIDAAVVLIASAAATASVWALRPVCPDPDDLEHLARAAGADVEIFPI